MTASSLGLNVELFCERAPVFLLLPTHLAGEILADHLKALEGVVNERQKQ